MCFSKPDIPKTQTPQEVKQPSTAALKGKKRDLTAGGTIITGPSGIAQGALATAAPTLLGG